MSRPAFQLFREFGHLMGGSFSQMVGQATLAMQRGERISQLYQRSFGHVEPDGKKPSELIPADMKANAKPAGDEKIPYAKKAGFGDIMGRPSATAFKIDDKGRVIPDIKNDFGNIMAGKSPGVGEMLPGLAAKGMQAAFPAEAAAGTGALAGLVGTAGPIAVVVGGLVAGVAAVTKGLGNLDDSLKAIASGDNAKAAKAAFDGLTDLSLVLPPLGPAFFLTGKTLGFFEEKLQDLTMAFVDRGREISGYSGQLSTSYALTDISQMLADIKEAQTMEGPLSRLNDAQNELSLMLRDLLLPIKEMVAGDLADFLKWGKEAINQLREIVVDKAGLVVAGLNAAHAVQQMNYPVLTAILDRLGISLNNARWEQTILNAMVRKDQQHDFGILQDWIRGPRDRNGQWAPMPRRPVNPPIMPPILKP